MVEWAEVFGHFYGTQGVVDESRPNNGIAVFDIDVQGGAKIKAKYPDTLLFSCPPSMEELERQPS